jgi:PAS domain S-box-containing protein
MPTNNDLPNLSLIDAIGTAIIDIIDVGVIIGDKQSVIIYWNRGAKDIFQYTTEEVIGKYVITITETAFEIDSHGGDDRPPQPDVDRMSENILGKTIRLEGTRKDGTKFPLELYVVMYQDHQQICSMAMVTDISSKIQTDIYNHTREKITSQIEEIKRKMGNTEGRILQLIHSNSGMSGSNDKMSLSNDSMMASNNQLSTCNDKMVQNNNDMINANVDLMISNDKMILDNKMMIKSNDDMTASNHQMIADNNSMIIINQKLIEGSPDHSTQNTQVNITINTNPPAS